MTTLNLDHTLVRSLVHHHLPIGFDLLRINPIATGKFNTSLWVETPDQRLVLRLAPPQHQEQGLLFYEKKMMRQEPTLHAIIGERTTIPIARLLGYDFSHSLIDRDYLIMEALPGVPLSEVPPNKFTKRQQDEILRQTGAYLRQLHALTAPECLGVAAYGYLGEHRPMRPQLSWQAAFRVMWRKLLEDVVACGGYSVEEAEALVALFEKYAFHFEWSVTPRLLHMDVWSQNILVDEQGQVTGLIDFDRALWGDPEIEFAVLDWCGLSGKPFWEGYGSERDESEAALIRRQFYLLYEVQKYIPIEIWRANNPQAAHRYKQRCCDLVEQLGLSL